MPKKQRILITGNNGYIGSVMAPWLRSQGYDVSGLDIDYFYLCKLVPELAQIPTIPRDLREVTARDLTGFDAVIHLAALSNDPIGNLNPIWTQEINGGGTIRPAGLGEQAGGPRVFFFLPLIHFRLVGGVVFAHGYPARP